MIQLIGLRHDVKLEVRERFSLNPKHWEETIIKIDEICDEAVVLSTCNRIEIYFNSEYDDEWINKIFDKLGWDKKLSNYFIHLRGKEAIIHLMDVVCGFDSAILGEDQILAQIKSAYDISIGVNQRKKELRELFHRAITCGKEFRTKSQLYKFPVSSSSVAVSVARKKSLRRFMILGYGEVGSLTAKYILSGEYDALYIAVRNIDMVDIRGDKIKVIEFKDRIRYYEDVDCIISCTSAPHCVVFKEDLPDKKMVIFDLAVPRDVEEEVSKMKNATVYDIDKIGLIDEENKQKRKEVMIDNRYIIDKYVKEFYEWQKIEDISQHIKKIKDYGEKVYKKRYDTFKHKKNTKDNEELAKILIQSTSNAYVNRAIEVLKDEYLKGRGDECLKIIQRIFTMEV